jgi:hypothetical protein
MVGEVKEVKEVKEVSDVWEVKEVREVKEARGGRRERKEAREDSSRGRRDSQDFQSDVGSTNFSSGDFLAPYLLSSLDKERGMIHMLNETPVDFVIFGNHKDDVGHDEQLCMRGR